MCSPIVLARSARGEILVKRLQAALTSQKVLSGKIDGDFGPKTEAAVMAFQTLKGLPVTGEVDAETWTAVTREPAPKLFERCLNLTSNFEAHGFTLAAGNWDNAGVTWGIIGFTIKSGSLKQVIDHIPEMLVRRAFGNKGYTEFRSALDNMDPRARIAWGQSISDPTRRPVEYAKLIEPWAGRFADLGAIREAQEAQLAVAEELYFKPAEVVVRNQLRWLDSTPRAYALAFDCHVQQGKVYTESIEAARARAPEGVDAAMLAIAHSQANIAPARFRDGVLARRSTIARGRGTVTGRSYDLRAYGLL